jgi:hypothetical protein
MCLDMTTYCTKCQGPRSLYEVKLIDHKTHQGKCSTCNTVIIVLDLTKSD